MNLLRTAILFATLLSVGHSASRKKSNDIARAILARLQNESEYNKEILPLDANAGPVKVKMSIKLRQVDFDEKNMKMTTDMTFRMNWRDLRLRYPNSKDVEDITFTDFSKFWVPDTFFKNAYETKMLTTIHPESYIRLFHNGDIIFSARYLVKSHCQMDLQRFPHDKQTCSIYLASYGYTKDNIVYEEPDQSRIHISEDIHSKRFHFTSIKATTCESSTITGAYSCIRIMLNIERRLSSYIVEWYIPCFLFVIISFFSHLIAAQNFIPRLLLSLGPLLTLASASLAYHEGLAQVGYVTALDVFSGVSLLTIFFSLLQTCVIYYYSSREEVDQPKEENLDGELPKDVEKTKIDRIKEFLRIKGDITSRVAIITFYVLFIFLYTLAYST